MNKKSMSMPVIAAAFAAATLMSACDKRDNTATPPMPQSTPSTTSPSTTSPSTTSPSTMPPAGSTGSMSPDSSASAPGMGASK